LSDGLWVGLAEVHGDGNRTLKRIRVYVAGPISLGDFILNIRRGIDAANDLKRLGFIPFCPFLDAFWQLVHHMDYEELLDQDFAWIEVCDAVFRMPGESPGADREVAHARKLGIPVYHSMAQLDREMPRK
jgi:hypothetical protein